jgi:regulator of sigma E protease
MKIGSIIVAILMFSLVVIFHELGHFLFAKKNGIGVTEFCLGMGPKLFGIKKGETLYSLRLFPIGGACMMVGEDENVDDAKAFNNKTVWQRFQVIFAGPLFNFILAFLLSMIMVAIAGYDPAYVEGVSEGSQAAQAGIMEGDLIVRYDGKKINFGREIAVEETLFNPIKDATPIEITYKRDGKKYTTTVVPQKNTRYLLGINYYNNDQPMTISQVVAESAFEEAGIVAGDTITSVDGTEIASGAAFVEYMESHPLDGSPVKIGYVHNSLDYEAEIIPRVSESYSLGFTYNTVTRKTSGFNVIRYSAAEVKYWIITTVKSLGQIFKGKVSRNDIGGPVRIVSEISSVMSEASPYGALMVILQLLNWCVLLSANLGVMNLLPIPALDGGRLLFLIIEGIRRKPVNREKEGLINGIFFVLLMILMVFVFYNDISNLFR